MAAIRAGRRARGGCQASVTQSAVTEDESVLISGKESGAVAGLAAYGLALRSERATSEAQPEAAQEISA